MKKLLTIVVCLFAAQALALHRHHKSSLYLQYDKDADRIQAIIEIDSGDFEHVIQTLAKDTDLSLEDLKQVGKPQEQALQYLKKHLDLQFDEEPLKLEWFDIKVDTRISKIYLRTVPNENVSLPTNLHGLSVKNTILFELNHNQKNYVFVFPRISGKVWFTDHEMDSVVVENDGEL